jgi:hypothetical protein
VMANTRRLFRSRVREDRDTGCWLWIGAQTTGGYGLLGYVRAHRVAWELWKGPIPEGL